MLVEHGTHGHCWGGECTWVPAKVCDAVGGLAEDNDFLVGGDGMCGVQ
jgi:hypothetical protein